MPLPATFAGTVVTGAQITSDGTIWFTCANGMLGVVVPGQVATPVTLNGIPVEVTSMVVDVSGNVWFATTNGQSGYCLDGQSAATLDLPAKSS